MPKPSKRFLHALNGKLGAAGFTVTAASVGVLGSATAATAIAGFLGGIAVTTVTTGIAAVATGGLALLVAPVIYAAWRTVRPRRRKDFATRKLEIESSDFSDPMRWDCYWIAAAVVGIARTGKSELKQRLQADGSTDELVSNATLGMERHFCQLGDETYVAFLDTRGSEQMRSDQLDLIKIAGSIARVIILVLDHADTKQYGNNTPLDPQRLIQQEDFIREVLIPAIGKEKPPDSPLRTVIAVMNKADAWEGKEGEEEIKGWFSTQVKSIKESFTGDVLSHHVSVEKRDHPSFAVMTDQLKQVAANALETD